MSDVSNAFDLNAMAATPNLSPPQSALAPPQSVLSAGRDQASQDFGAAAQLAQQDVNRERQMAEQQRGQVTPFRQAAMEANARPLPQPPQHQQPPKPPTMEDAQQQTWQQEWLTAAMFLGTLGGALTRRPLTNSLAAFTGMIEGVNEGNKQKFDTSMKTWEAENKRVLEANDQANKEYDQILKNRSLDTEQKMVMLQLKAMELKDDAMAQATVTKNQIAVAQLFDERVRRGAELQGAQTRRDDEQQQRALQWVNSNEGQQRAKAIAEYRLAPPSTLGRTGYQGAINTALMDKVLEVNPDYNVNKFKAEGIREAIPARAEAAAATASARTLGTRGTNLETIIRGADILIPDLRTAAAAVPRTDWVPINKLMQMADTEINNPALKRFKMFNYEIASLWGRSMNPTGVLRVDDRQKALDNLLTADTPGNYDAALHAIDDILRREKQSIDDQKAGRPLPEGVNWADTASPAGATLVGAGGGVAGRAVNSAESAVPGSKSYLEDIWDRAKRKGWSLTPLDER
jgi:hypothetical protein